MDFSSLIQQRRSANKFIEGVQITENELNEIFNQTKLSPSAFNLQHVHYFVILDQDTKNTFYEQAIKQYKVKTASAVLVVLGDLHAYQNAPEIYAGMRALRIMSQEQYDQTIQAINGMYEGNHEFQYEEAIRNASLSAMQFMLVAKDNGWDTCPMIGFDRAETVKMFNIPEQYVPVMLIAIGKSDPSSERKRGYRKPIGEFVTYDRFR